MTRLRSLEQLRGFGVMLMVFLHGALYHYGGLQQIDLSHPPLIVTLIGFLLMWGGLFAVLSGASHAIRAVERLDQGVAVLTVRRWEWISGGGYLVLGAAYFTLVGPTLVDLSAGTRDSSLLVELIEFGVVQAPSLARWLYMNTLFMIGFSTLLVAPVFARVAQRHDPRSPRFRWAIAALAFLALVTSWLRIPLYPLYEQATAEGRTGFLLLSFWLVNKNDPMWPSLGLTLSGTLLGLMAVAPAEPGRLHLPVGLGVLLLASGIAGWVFGPASMLRRSIDMTWLSITLTQAGFMLLGVVGFHHWLDGVRRTTAPYGPIARTLRRFSQASLSVLFGETVLAQSAARGLDALAAGWDQSLTAAVLFGVGSVGVWTLILARWERRNYRGSIEQGWVRVMAALSRPSTRLDGARG
jgi:hypothetical protein